MDRERISERLTGILRDTILVPETTPIKPESAFIDDLGIDSLDVVELGMCIEDAFDIEIGPDLSACTTVGAACDLIAAKLAG